MKATSKLHICPEHHSDLCLKKWYAVSVEDEPIYEVCKECNEYDCQDMNERVKGGD